jgi:hypothetical protein
MGNGEKIWKIPGWTGKEQKGKSIQRFAKHQLFKEINVDKDSQLVGTEIVRKKSREHFRNW